MPLTSRDFQRAAAQRMETAEFLWMHHYNLDSMYLAGYTIECSLKALILDLTPDLQKQETHDKITNSGIMHDPEILLGILGDLGCGLPLELSRRLR